MDLNSGSVQAASHEGERTWYVTEQQILNGKVAVTAELARQLLLSGAAAEILDRISRLARLATRAPVTVLGIVDADHLVIVGQSGLPDPWSTAGQLPLEATFCRYVQEAGDMVVVEDASVQPRNTVIPLENFSCAAYCGAPVRVGARTVAVLSVQDVRSRRWTTDDVAVIRGLAVAAARDLERLEALTAVPGSASAPEASGMAETPEPSQARAAAEPPAAKSAAHDRSGSTEPVERTDEGDSESHYRRLFDGSSTALFVLAADGKLLEVNRACEELLGRPRDELYRMRLAELAVDVAEFEHVFSHLTEQGYGAEAEVRLRRGGDELICSLSVGPQAMEDGMAYHGALRDVTDERRTQEQLVRSALHDPLTSLPNRVVFMDRLERLMKQANRRSDVRFAVMFLDLDDFKTVNDTYGHLVGDQLLVAVARRLEACVRDEDTVARIGGDEFAILLDTVQDAASVILVADRIRESLARPFNAGGCETGTSTSIGIAMSASGYDSGDDLLRDADAAMYRAKAAGRDDYVIFDSDMHDRAVAQRQLEVDLRAAVSQGQLAVHYHPVVELDNGSVTGLEALVRWSHPERGILLPAEFIPLAEQTGIIVDIGWWVLREACRQLRAWQLDYPDVAFKLTMSVNLSARQFVHPALVDQIDRILEETQLDARCLRFDLKEAVVMQNVTLAARLLQQLRDRGIQICLDDFGTGYTSLQQLREFQISTLKIDRSFIGRMSGGSVEGKADGRAIVQSIIALGRSMSIDALAEGVETAEQLEQLRLLGMRFAQGFLFSRPLDGLATTSLLAESV